MKLLLDTHTFLWWLSSPNLLSQSAKLAIADPANEVCVSVITLWEIAIKRAIGKLQAPVDLQSDVARVGFQLLSLTVNHVVATERLPMYHRDPFDRMLIAQAQLEGATLVTRDPLISQYGVPLIVA